MKTTNMKTTIIVMIAALLFVTACTTQEEIDLSKLDNLSQNISTIEPIEPIEPIDYYNETIGYYNNTNNTIDAGQAIYLNLSDDNNTIYIKENDTFVKTNITLEEE